MTKLNGQYRSDLETVEQMLRRRMAARRRRAHWDRVLNCVGLLCLGGMLIWCIFEAVLWVVSGVLR